MADRCDRLLYFLYRIARRFPAHHRIIHKVCDVSAGTGLTDCFIWSRSIGTHMGSESCNAKNHFTRHTVFSSRLLGQMEYRSAVEKMNSLTQVSYSGIPKAGHLNRLYESAYLLLIEF